MKKLIFLILCALSVTTALFCQIQESSSTKDVLPLAKPHTLVVFDIDDTIYTAAQAVGSDVWFCHLLEKYKKEGHSCEEARLKALDLWMKIQRKTDVQLIEACTKEVLDELQNKKIVLMALTTRGDYIADCTINQLTSLGISMKKSSPDPSSFSLKEMPQVLWKEGILFTAGYHKGHAFCHFLDQINYLPTEVLFINDKSSNLKEVAEACNMRNIPFIGLRYSASDDRVANFRPEIAELQLKEFETILFEAILSDKISK